MIASLPAVLDDQQGRCLLQILRPHKADSYSKLISVLRSCIPKKADAYLKLVQPSVPHFRLAPSGPTAKLQLETRIYEPGVTPLHELFSPKLSLFISVYSWKFKRFLNI